MVETDSCTTGKPVRVRALLFGCAALALTSAVLAPFVPGLRLALGAVCHQEGGVALCARCIGIYCGLAAAAIAPVWKTSHWAAAMAGTSAVLWLCGVTSSQVRFVLGAGLAWTGASWLITLLLCPTTARAERNYRPTRDSAINAESPSAKNR